MITVAQLIAILQTMPQDIPVTSYNGQECTDFVTRDGVRLTNTDFDPCLRLPDGTKYVGEYLDIMGF